MSPMRRGLLVLLVVSGAARMGLALSGGQYFFGDEHRYGIGVALYQAIRTGDMAAAGAHLLRPEHAAFSYVAMLVAAGQHGLAQFTPWGDWTQAANIPRTAGFAAALLSLISVLNLWLVHRLARAAGAGETEAGWVVLLLAASNAFFYFSRHLVPYDAALAAALGGLVFALSPDRRDAWKSGALAATCYQLYNGYWFLVPLGFLFHLLARPDRAARVRASAAWLAGGVGATVVLMLPGFGFGGAAYWDAMRGFSGSVTQGLFSEGWSFAGEYLWHAEGWLGAVAAVAAGYALFRATRPGADAGRLRGWGWLLLGAYLLPVAASVGLQKFVVYGRTVRPLVPLVCLLAGYGLHRFTLSRPRWRPALAGLIILSALLNFAPHFRRVFPRDFAAQVERDYDVTKHWVSFTGTIYYQPDPTRRPDLAVVNAQYIYPVRDFLGYPAGLVMRAAEHPLAYPPYQYEGHAPRERRLLRAHPPVMLLVQLAHPETVPDHPPPEFTFQKTDRPDGHDRGRPQ